MYQGHAGKLILYNKDQEVITVSTKINQNLYKFSFESATKNNSSESIYVITNQSLQSWEIWHRCFGHKAYMSHLQIRGHVMSTIKIDCGTEFLNQPMKTWCDEQGIELHLTAPYSPSQNGVAECMNRTLVELARVMLTASHLPEFLWEPVVNHAAYVRNRSYIKAIQNK